MKLAEALLEGISPPEELFPAVAVFACNTAPLTLLGLNTLETDRLTGNG